MRVLGAVEVSVDESMAASIAAGPAGAVSIDATGHYRGVDGKYMFAPNGVSWTVENWEAHKEVATVNYGTRPALEMEPLITGYMDKGMDRLTAVQHAIADYDRKHKAPIVPLAIAAAAVVAAYFFLS